jgi:hypothetical protein
MKGREIMDSKLTLVACALVAWTALAGPPRSPVVSAEISRQLGDFTAATLLLDFEFPTDYAGSLHVITKLTAEEDFTVRQVA